MSQKYNAPGGAPPAYDGSSQGASQISSPAPAHTPYPAPQSELYNASPYEQPTQPYPNQYQDPHPPTANGYYGPPQMQQGGGGYYQQPPMGYGPGYGPQSGYGPQGGYYNGGYAPGYGPQGQYMDNRRGGSGFMEAMLASLACCCCLDACLLF
ncbi:hypothetical protein N431DRAFT_432185 [Stipitochalara longipes BDJ]|nr:hypothetical protein N431DRAFT_432185 [Stipitochalara longipes BDJ]